MNFEESIKELENIAAKLESGNVSLDESLKLYEKAVLLSKECNDLLEKAKLKISYLNDNKAEEQ